MLDEPGGGLLVASWIIYYQLLASILVDLNRQYYRLTHRFFLFLFERSSCFCLWLFLILGRLRSNLEMPIRTFMLFFLLFQRFIALSLHPLK